MNSRKLSKWLFCTKFCLCLALFDKIHLKTKNNRRYYPCWETENLTPAILLQTRQLLVQHSSTANDFSPCNNKNRGCPSIDCNLRKRSVSAMHCTGDLRSISNNRPNLWICFSLHFCAKSYFMATYFAIQTVANHQSNYLFDSIVYEECIIEFNVHACVCAFEV